jgi:hypothetical protein
VKFTRPKKILTSLQRKMVQIERVVSTFVSSQNFSLKLCRQAACQPGDDRFLKRSVTCHEKWVFYRNPYKKSNGSTRTSPRHRFNFVFWVGFPWTRH